MITVQTKKITRNNIIFTLNTSKKTACVVGNINAYGDMEVMFLNAKIVMNLQLILSYSYFPG